MKKRHISAFVFALMALSIHGSTNTVSIQSDIGVCVQQSGRKWLSRAETAKNVTFTNEWKIHGNAIIITNKSENGYISETYIITKGVVNSIKIIDMNKGIAEGFQYSTNGNIVQYWKTATNSETSEAMQFDRTGKVQMEVLFKNGKVVTNSLGEPAKRSEWDVYR